MTVIDDPVDQLGQTLYDMPAEERTRFLATLNEDEFDAAQAAITRVEAANVDWRSSPARMAHHLTGGTYELYPYATELGDRFAGAFTGTHSTKQQWWLPSQYGKPVSVKEQVTMGDGRLRRLADIMPGDMVVTHLGRSRRVLAVHEQGWLDSVRITTAAGRTVTAALDHPFLTADGWVEARKLRSVQRRIGSGHVLAAVTPDLQLTTARLAEEFRLAGYFIGDGSVTGGAAIVTCEDPTEGADLGRCAEALGWKMAVKQRSGPLWKAARYSFRAGDTGRDNGPRPWLREADIAGRGSHEKRIPAWVMSAPDTMVAHFIGAYFACDGCVAGKEGGTNTGRSIEFYSMSRDLLADTQHLLTRLGIASRLQPKRATDNNFRAGPIDSWRLTTTGADMMARFAELIPLFSVKAAKLAGLDLHRQRFESHLIPDPVVEIENVGLEECRCLTVEEDSSFTVSDLAVHNTTIAANWGPVWALDRNPRLRIMYVSFDANKAVEECGKCRDLVIEHERELRFKLRPDRKARGRWLTPEGGGLYGVGVDGGITGWPIELMIVDDILKGWQAAHSPAIREHAWGVYRSQIRLRMQPKSNIVFVIGTRWHEDDVSARLRKAQFEDPAADQWEVLRLAAIAEEPTTNPTADPIYRVPDQLGRQPGELLGRYPMAEVMARRAGLGTYLTNALEQQRPTAEEGGELRRDWFRVSADLPPAFDDEIASWDMKLKDKESGDFVVGQWWGRTGKDCWMGDQLRGQWNQATTENAIALMLVRHPGIRRTFIENTGNGPEVMEELRAPRPEYVLSADVAGQLGMTEGEHAAVQALRRRGMGALIPVNPKGTKSVRMRAHAGHVEGGDVHLYDRPYVPGLLEEAAQFPNGTHDDQIDAMSQALSNLLHTAARISRPAGTLPKTSIDTRTGGTMGVNGRRGGGNLTIPRSMGTGR